jgi:nicotinamidase/pyrazinamidase
MKPDRETALVVVDVQNDFVDPSGSLYVAGGNEAIGYINEHASPTRGERTSSPPWL